MVLRSKAQNSLVTPGLAMGDPRRCLHALIAALRATGCVCFGLWLLVSASPVWAGHSSKKSARKAQHEHAAKPVAKTSAPSAGPTIRLEHLTTRDSLSLRPGKGRGGFAGGAMGSVSRVLRCHHTGKRHSISPRLVSVLYATARHFHSSHIYVVAGYRAPAVARKKGNPRSAHKRGVACDFRLDGVGIETIRDYLRATYHNVGVGYYPNAGFIHVDVGRSHSAYWIDYSRPGEKARYAQGASAPTGTGTAPATTIPASEATRPAEPEAAAPAAEPEVGEESGG